MSSNRKNILIIGTAQLNFLGPLYYGLEKESGKKFCVKSTHFRIFSKDDFYNDIFKKIDKEKLTITTKASYYKHLLYFVCHISVWKIYFKQRKIKHPKKIRSFLREMFDYYKHAQEIKKTKNIDMYHVHFLRIHTILPFLFINDKPVIMSFWGSDLLRYKDVKEDLYRSFALKNANVITIQNEQLAALVKKRFPIINKRKIKIVKFLFNEENLNRFKKEGLDKQRNKNNECHIMVAHNGTQENQHIPILKAISKIKTNKDIHVHLLLSYALLDDYHKVLLEYLKEYKFSVHLQYEYLSEKKLASYRSIMDILIFAPTTDAMSGTVTEALYIGTKVIAGSWLPYNDYKAIKNSGLYLFDNFDTLPNCIEKVISQKENIDLKEVHKGLDAIFGVTSNAQNWIQIMEDL